MTCRDEVLAAADKLVVCGVDSFTLEDVESQMHCRRTGYKDSTISTHVTSRMCTNAPQNNETVYDDLVRVGRGLYSLNRPVFKWSGRSRE